jgi:hypothetical protein
MSRSFTTPLRAATLVNYTAFRTYQVVDLNGKVHAQEVGQMEYCAPDQKKFAVTSEKGSVLVRRLALNALSPVRSKPRRVSSITIALSPGQTTLWTCSVSNWWNVTTASLRRRFPNGETNIYSKARYGLTRKIMRSSGLMAIPPKSFLSGSNEQPLCVNTKRSTVSGFRKEI